MKQKKFSRRPKYEDEIIKYNREVLSVRRSDVENSLVQTFTPRIGPLLSQSVPDILIAAVVSQIFGAIANIHSQSRIHVTT